jgi:thiamine-phosphate pyrophosphorylase
MGSQNCRGRDPRAVLEDALAGGVTLVQFREKGEAAKKGEDLVKLAMDLKGICHQKGIPFLINDDVDLAVEVDADGVHIGQDDSEYKSVRKKLSAGKIIGVSCHSLEEAKDAVHAGADYIGVGPMYFTQTKEDIQDVKGPQVIKQIREAGLSIPIVGIGGISKSNAPEVLKAGADGMAVISAITHAAFPMEAAKELSAVHNSVKNKSLI